MAPHRWTFSKALWNAQSSPEFFSKWRDKPTFIINSFYVHIIAKVARPADIDDFARLFLTVLVPSGPLTVCTHQNDLYANENWNAVLSGLRRQSTLCCRFDMIEFGATSDRMRSMIQSNDKVEFP